MPYLILTWSGVALECTLGHTASRKTVVFSNSHAFIQVANLSSTKFRLEYHEKKSNTFLPQTKIL